MITSFSGGYNGNVPGPTLRFTAGSTRKVVLNNLLADIDNPSTPENDHNSPNSTNFHTHGLHVSSLAPGDNVQTVVPPQTSYEFTYDVPASHMGGTHWYHPHHHGSTALQAGGAAAGLLIIEDAEGEVPDVISAMLEIPLIITHVDMELLQEIQEEFNTALWQVKGTSDAVLLVNGQTTPTLAVTEGVWMRFRMLYAAIESTATLAFTASSSGVSCEMGLMAKDGVYLEVFPRRVTELPLYPGARADVAVRCTGSGTVYLGSGNLNLSRRRLTPEAEQETMHRRILLQGGGGGGGSGGGGGGPPPSGGGPPGRATGPNAGERGTGRDGGREGETDSVEGLVLTLEVSSSGISAQPDLPYVRVQRPCYLANTLEATPDVTQSLSLGGGGLVLNGQVYESGSYLNADTPFETGQLVQLKLSGIDFHPFHMHVNSYQITSDLGCSGYFQKGDWHDTLYISGGSTFANVNFFTDLFAGNAMVHCHILEHEDQGMMGMFLIGGTEGATYADAEILEPTCHRGATRGFVLEEKAPQASASCVAEKTDWVILGVGSGAGLLLLLTMGVCYMHWRKKSNQSQADKAALAKPAIELKNIPVANLKHSTEV